MSARKILHRYLSRYYCFLRPSRGGEQYAGTVLLACSSSGKQATQKKDLAIVIAFSEKNATFAPRK
jgi:hypothetical protein